MLLDVGSFGLEPRIGGGGADGKIPLGDLLVMM